MAAISAAGVLVDSGGRPVPVLRLETNPGRLGELRLPRDEKSKIGKTMSECD